jgi:hypothetical protein
MNTTANYTVERDTAGSIYWYVKNPKGAVVAAYYSEYAAQKFADTKTFADAKNATR